MPCSRRAEGQAAIDQLAAIRPRAERPEGAATGHQADRSPEASISRPAVSARRPHPCTSEDITRGAGHMSAATSDPGRTVLPTTIGAPTQTSTHSRVKEVPDGRDRGEEV